MNKILLHSVNANFFLDNLYPQISKNGYPEHFLVGVVIGVIIFFIVHKKTANSLKSWIFAVTIVATIGLFKELIDPSIGRQRDKTDLVFTIFGGLIGTGMVALFKKNKTT